MCLQNFWPDVRCMQYRTVHIIIAVSMVLAPLAAGQDTTSPFPVLGGWTFGQDETIYNPDNLWDVIDGAADLFLEYGFVDLHIGRYHKGEDSEIKVELYKFDSPADAFGMYSQERNPQHPFMNIGIQAYREEGVLNFLTGKYYIKIMTHERGREALDAMTLIAKSLNGRLRQDNNWPPILSILPLHQKNPNSEQYIAQNFLGYPFFRAAYTAQYGNEKPFRMFVIAVDSLSESKSIFDEFVKVSPGGLLERSPVVHYWVRDRYNGSIELLQTRNYIAGIVGLEDRELCKSYLDDILKGINTLPVRNHVRE